MYSFSCLEPVCCSMSGSNCCFLTCIHISQETDQVIWYSHLLKNFPQFVVIHTVKGFDIVNKAEVYVFLELSCFFDDPSDVGNLISGSSAFSKSSLNICKFTVHVLLKLGWRILSVTLLVCEMSAIVQWFEDFWHCLSLGLEWKVTFSSPVATAEFSKFSVTSPSCNTVQKSQLQITKKKKKNREKEKSVQLQEWKWTLM